VQFVTCYNISVGRTALLNIAKVATVSVLTMCVVSVNSISRNYFDSTDSKVVDTT